MKKINIGALVIIATGILTLFTVTVFFQFYTLNENGEKTGNWPVKESIMYLGTARAITLIAGVVIALGILMYLVSRKKTEEKQNISGILFIAAGALIIIGSLNAFYPCTDMMRNGRPMRCYRTMKALLGIAGAIGISGVLMLLLNRSREFIKGMNSAVIVFCCLFLLTPVKLTEGFCLSVMPCIERFRPFTLMTGCFMLVMSVINMFLLNRKREKAQS